MDFLKASAAALSAVMIISLCACDKGGDTSSDSTDIISGASEISSEEIPRESFATGEAPHGSEVSSEPVKEEPQPSAVALQYAEKAEELRELYGNISAEKDFPAINITTLDNEAILSKDYYVESVVDVFNYGDDEIAISAEAGVKVRGNSTANDDEKPYRIKFNEKRSMLGLHNGRAYKSWVLLRSYWNLAPDYMGLNLAKEIFEGKYYSSDCTYVNLYVNGESKGLYLLCEQNQAANGRIDVTEPVGSEAPDEIGYMLEMDNYPDENEHPFFVVVHGKREFTDITGITRTFVNKCYSIRSDTTTQEQRDFIEKYIGNVFTILFEAADGKLLMFDEKYDLVSAESVYKTPKEAVEAVIDTVSLANYLILEELAQDYDVGEGSFYMAVDFGKNSIYPRLTFLAPWDFNWGYSEDPSGGYYACTYQKFAADSDRSNAWFITAMKQEWFRDIVKERWQSLSERKAVANAVRYVRDSTALLANDLGEDSWKTEKAVEICAYVMRRKRWLDGEWSVDDQ